MAQPVVDSAGKVVLERELRAMIERIPIERFRKLAEALLELAPGSFWRAPASSSGKFHPPDERDEGGTVLHTIRVMRVAEDLCRAYEMDDKMTSMIMVAALLHDMYKGGDGPIPREHTWPLHQVAPRFLLRGELYELPIVLHDEELDLIFRMVESHEGRWSILPDARDFDYAGLPGQILHIADYVASRSYVFIDITDLDPQINLKPGESRGDLA